MSVGMLAAAQVTRPGTPAEFWAIVPTVVVFVAQGLGAKVPWLLFAAVGIVPVTVVVGYRGDLELALFFPVMATLYTAWHMGSTIRAAVVLIAAVAVPWLVSDHLAPASGIGWVPWATASGFTFALGLTLRRQRSLITQLEAAREALAEQAVAEERRRIARELHDLAGYTLAAMMLHVTGARHVLERDPTEARQALLDAEQVGRASLDQIRATVAALRTDERGIDPSTATAVDLVDLVDVYRRAGLNAELVMDEQGAQLTGPVGTALHRIAQEALANVARHAPNNAATVVVTTAGASVALVVSDRGERPTGQKSNEPHFGLVGMRERARALGGHLTAGPVPDGWRVEATLPLVGTGREHAAPSENHEAVDAS